MSLAVEFARCEVPGRFRGYGVSSVMDDCTKNLDFNFKQFNYRTSI